MIAVKLGGRNNTSMVEIVVFERGVGHFEHKFQGNGASPTNRCWLQKT